MFLPLELQENRRQSLLNMVRGMDFHSQLLGIKELRYSGLAADIIICRTEEPMHESSLKKVALFGGVSEDKVSCSRDFF
jgi:CTP synthase (UTP-ammonia lyase)